MSVLRDAIKALDPAPDKKKELTLALNLISELAEQKKDEFDYRVRDDLRTAGSEENRTIPITEILASHHEYKAYVSSDAGKIANDVANAIRAFVSGGTEEIIDGVAGLVTTALEAIIGAGSATQQEMASYYIIVQDYGIVRYDIMGWTRAVEAVGITQQIETAMAVVAFKSSVDVKRISYNTFLIAYGSQLSKMGFSNVEIEEYLDYAETIYQKLIGYALPDPGSSVASGLPGGGSLPAQSSFSEQSVYKLPADVTFSRR